jgi:hypothetical protein
VQLLANSLRPLKPNKLQVEHLHSQMVLPKVDKMATQLVTVTLEVQDDPAISRGY